ncbi:FadR/GntR family transcriptional regulator [Alsobacter soli]|nr:FadR/GntR family transcriptional regulator [Alsobacter soli]
MTLASRSSSRPFKRSLKDQVVESLGGDIVAGRLAPGALLPAEDVLLARYDVSRTVLREAVNVLAAKGLLDPRPKRGTVIRPPSDWSQLDPDILEWREANGIEFPGAEEVVLDQLMEIRRIVEPGAAALAAVRATDSDLALMRAAYEGMERATVAEAFMEADLAFHLACLSAGHNDFLLPVAHAIRSAMMTSLRVTNRDPHENRSVSLPLHRAVLDAIIARDPAAARAAMEIHLDDTEQRRARAGRVTPGGAARPSPPRRPDP